MISKQELERNLIKQLSEQGYEVVTLYAELDIKISTV